MTKRSSIDSKLDENLKTKVLLITDDPFEIRAAVLENSRPVEFFADRRDHPKLSGNIYLGKVKDILPGMEAAFIDIGLERNAFLYVKEILNGNSELSKDTRIEDLLKKGQELLVQVAREPRGTKGARLTTQITLPGRYLVLVPNTDIAGFSKKLEIEDAARIEPILSKLDLGGMGMIVRTAAFEADEAQLKKDLRSLKLIWKEIDKTRRTSSAPALLFSENDFSYRIARDRFTDDFARLVVDSKDKHRDLVRYFKKVNPDLVSKIELYENSKPLFDHFNIDEAFDALIKRVIWLRSGGFITIDRTEAMTVIDVNTGKFVGKSNLADTIYKTNIEAADEICKQLRLRDMGGIIVVDFIDMNSVEQRAKVHDRLIENVLDDRTKVRVSEWSEFGIIQITRKGVATPICDILMDKCPSCDGYGRQVSLLTHVKKCYRMLESALSISPHEAFIVGIEQEILDAICRESDAIKRLKKKTGKKIIFVESQEVDENCYIISAGTEKAMKAEASVLRLNLLN